MGNMSYCRFTNTLSDLQDCYNHLNDSDEELSEEGGMSEDEKRARNDLVELCKMITEEFDY